MRSTNRYLSCLLALLCCSLPQVKAIINRPPVDSVSKHLGSSYLNQQRPLWILEDQVPRSDYAELVYTTPSPYNYHLPQMQQLQALRHSAPQLQQVSPPNRVPQLHQPKAMRVPQPIQHIRQQTRVTKQSTRLPLPRRYLPLQRLHFPQRQRPFLARKKPRFMTGNPVAPAPRRENYIPRLSMPTFDSMPGDESERAAPVFIYAGPKGELILNTMLTAPQYPMQEPVPGQVLYPPSVPVFRPKPIVERFRMPGSTQTLNLTLIPFYEHEAIDIRQASHMLNPEQALPRESATTEQATVVYAAPAAMPPIADSATAESAPTAKKLRMKKGKHYSAYHSPNEVQWTPMTREQLRLVTSTTTPFPLTAPSPPQNHRFINDMEVSSTTPPSFANYKITYKSETDSVEDDVEKDELLMDGDRLRIVCVDDSLERPTAPTKAPLQSSRYSLSKEYYAFPVFTLGKLLKSEAEGAEKELPTFMMQNTIDSPVENNRKQQMEDASEMPINMTSNNVGAEESEDSEADDVETWFILNSRYKGQHRQNNNEYRLSSKYIHTTDVREPDE
ncbi:uncharacterized protein LOC105212740 [Zeugodacus cucurbitae]|uniref:uncharacterized protein LOC105212740 n=1 Tax=Zeugodacus cucurbitae TaxID=28588 RepID=UPI0005968B00|nr:uncharacterized protein LOC105212740 [Zeugodacus cucurbitae]